jgi:hypothetical protein
MRRFACLIALGFALTACGGDSADTPEDTPGDSTGSPASVPSAPIDTMPREVPEGWTMGPLGTNPNLSRTTPGTRVPMLQLIRTEPLETADRITLEFTTAGIPAYNAEYISGPLKECGTNKEIEGTSRAFLQLRLDPSSAHSPEGTPTFAEKLVELTGANVKKAYITCDFEGQVTVVFALEAKTPFHISRLEGPTRIVIDVMK